MSQSKTVINNFFWRFFERCGAQGVSLIVSIVLARLLDPDVYGTIALVTVFTSILQVFVDSGFSTALVQKKNADDLDFSSVFYFNMLSCSVLYVGIFFAAPLIAKYYGIDELTPIVRVMSLSLIISGVKSTQQAYVSRNMLFKRFFWATLGGTIGAAILGIWMAYAGYGVWALVAQNLFNMTVDTIILWVTVKWRPKAMFSFRRLKELFSFGWKLLAAGLIDRVYTELRQLIIGKRYSTEDLAYYNKGNTFPRTIVTNINSSIDSVLLPAMSAEQDNRTRVKAMTRRAIKINTYLMMPIMMGLAVCAEPLVALVLTEKWLPCVLYMRIFCFSMAFHTVHTANLNAIKAMGRSDLFLILETIKKAIGLILVAATMFISVEAMAYSLLLSCILSQIINSWPNKKLLGYRYLEQVKDMLPHILLSCVMGAAVYCVTFLRLSDVVTLLIQVPLGIVLYVALSALFRIESFTYLLDILKSYLHKRHAAPKAVPETVPASATETSSETVSDTASETTAGSEDKTDP